MTIFHLFGVEHESTMVLATLTTITALVIIAALVVFHDKKKSTVNRLCQRCFRWYESIDDDEYLCHNCRSRYI